MPYDSVVILGYRPTHPDTWRFPNHIYDSLDRAVELYKQGNTRSITLSGKWTINFDILHIRQPFRECDAMADYLLQHDVPEKILYREGDSQDSISNFYYLKRLVFMPRRLRRLHFIAAEARLPRIAFLATRILGADYVVSFEGVAYDPAEVSPNESRTLCKQATFLEPMLPGDDSWLEGRFYDDPFYQAVKARVRERAHLEPFIHLAEPQ